MQILEFPVTIAYNVPDKKIGCVLIQAAMGATIPRSWMLFTFDTKHWELNPSKCVLYNFNSQQEIDLMIRLTMNNE